ncbi:MFS general substrate transporter [Basidiobolus meristosporus CBS 931.73]|uniref:MFS general substrate transporter n=1 Tax=Basidiobolus meristosporus CBS 931.73 TaxID=1314790 RepID=A0A1Y1YDV4_9FUNG|nr:MFS general substrate transporter [Basidiobolus meristosporus CBS 931.73]|eukprot:ORX96148.1 MFS general substrate transporter [Basidiobolus meristosporus CBS 931.73]
MEKASVELSRVGPPLKSDVAGYKETNEFPEGGWGWLVVASSFLIHFIVLGLQYTFGVYQQHYAAIVFPGVKESKISFIGTLGSSILFIFGLVSGRLADMYGFKRIQFLGNVILCGGLIIASFASEVWHLYLSQGVLYGLGGSLCFFPAVSVPSQWFTKRRGLATGIAVSGGGIGGLALAPITRSLISKVGFRWSLRILGLGGFVLLSIASILLRTRIQSKPNTPILDFLLFRNPRFTVLFLIGMIVSFGYLVPFFFLPNYVLYTGLSVEMGSLLLGLLNGSSALGRVVLGFLADGMGRINSLFLSLFVGTLSIFLLWSFATGFTALLCFVLLYGFTAGGFVSLFPVVASEVNGHAGIEKLATVNGFLYVSIGIGSLIGIPIAGVILDASQQYGHFSYIPTIMYSGAMMLLGSILAGVLKFLKA